MNKSKNGFTLIEVIIAMAILGVVTLMIGSVFFYGINGFTKVRFTHEKQFDMRLIIDEIEDEIRNAKTIDLIELKPTSPGVNYIYFDDDGNFVRIGKMSYGIDSENVTDITFDLFGEDLDNLILSITVNGTDGVVLETEVMLNNITVPSDWEDITGKHSIEFTRN